MKAQFSIERPLQGAEIVPGLCGERCEITLLEQGFDGIGKLWVGDRAGHNGRTKDFLFKFVLVVKKPSVGFQRIVGCLCQLVFLLAGLRV